MSDLPKNDPVAESFLTHFTCKEELRAWILTYLDIDFPIGSIEPESNSSPVEWLYDAYAAVRDNKGGEDKSMDDIYHYTVGVVVAKYRWLQLTTKAKLRFSLQLFVLFLPLKYPLQ